MDAHRASVGKKELLKINSSSSIYLDCVIFTRFSTRTEEQLAAEAAAREEEQKQRELEEKQMTLQEYIEKQKKENAPPSAAFAIRTVDDSGFKGMVANKKKDEDDTFFQVGKKEKKQKQVEQKEKKEKVTLDVGFRMV